MSVTFLPLTEQHRPMLMRWLSTPHAQEWWGEPEDELRLIYAVEEGEHEPFIACVNGQPIAYIQAWWPAKHSAVPWAKNLSPSTRGIDITIGEPENLGRGLGSLIVRHFAAKLFADGATRLIIDPDATNERAIAAYMKAGFTPYDEVDGDLLMELLPSDLEWMGNV